MLQLSSLVGVSLCALSCVLAVPTPASSSSREEPHPFLVDLPWDVHQDPHERFDAHLRENNLHSQFSKRWDIPTNGLPPYPVYPWITLNESSWPILANAAVRRMQTWYTDGSPTYTTTSWWQQPVILASYMDLDEALQAKTNQQVVQNMLSNNERGQQYIIDAYVDDQAWWGLITAKAYQIYGNSAYLSAAKAIQANDLQYWTGDCGGGLLWLTYKPEFGKNTVTNTLHIAMDARLYRITGDQSYLDDAIKVLNCDKNTGKIYDTLTAYDCKQTYQQLFTYNSGIIIGGLVDLYLGTNSTSYLNLAKTIAYAAIRDYSTSAGIMREHCEHDGPPKETTVSAADGGPNNNLPAGCQPDEIAFKGILAQNLGYLYRASPDPVLYNYITYNLLWSSVYNMDNTFLFGEWWDGPFNKTLANQFTQINALGLLSSGVSMQATQRKAAGQPVAVANTFTVPLPN